MRVSENKDFLVCRALAGGRLLAEGGLANHGSADMNR